MGVDFLTCTICGNTFPDCGPGERCGGCWDSVCVSCYEGQKEKYGLADDPEVIEDCGERSLKECDSCTDSIIRDNTIVEFLIKKYDLDKDKIIEEIKNTRS